MSREGNLMRKALRKHFLPEMLRLGFVGTRSSFQRLGSDFLDLLSIQYWKYGGEFILEFARRERGDLITSWGELVPESKLEVAYVNPLNRARLVRATNTSNFGGFQFGTFGNDVAAYDVLAARVAALLVQADNW